MICHPIIPCGLCRPCRDGDDVHCTNRRATGLDHDGGFAVLGRDDAVVHLWEAGDETWRNRDSIERPVQSGAESFIAGTASCRIRVEELRGNDVLHPVSKDGVDATDFGTREFATLDSDGNLVTFFQWVAA